MANKRLSVKNLVDYTAEELGKKTEKEVKSLLSASRSLFKIRMKSFKKPNAPYSPAVHYMEDYYDEGYKKISKMSRNQALAELFQIQTFFKSKGSTIRGANQIIKQQDIRLFGANIKGKPNYTMTTSQRKKFWAVYDEYLNQHPTADLIYGSERIQSYLSYLAVKGENLDDIQVLIDELEEELAKAEEGSEADVYKEFFGEAYKGGWRG